MATIQLSKLVLTDNFPGPVNSNQGVPANGWNNGGACVTSPEYPVGEKRMAYTDNTHCPGWTTFYYGTLACYSNLADVSADFSDGKFWCSHCCLTADAADATYEMATNDGSSSPAYVLATCYTAAGWDGTKGAPLAIPCATMDGYDYGWFWVGGVCPCKDVTVLQGTAGSEAGADVTTSDVKPGPFMLVYDTAAAKPTYTDITAITDATGAVGAIPIPLGQSMEAD